MIVIKRIIARIMMIRMCFVGVTEILININGYVYASFDVALVGFLSLPDMNMLHSFR